MNRFHFPLAALAMSSVIPSPAMASDDGKALYQQHCASCHGTPGEAAPSPRLAPDMAMVKQHYLGSNPDRDAFVMVVADWVEQPARDKSLMMGAIRRFGVMPAIAVPTDDVEKIAGYVFDKVEVTQEMRDHIHRMHGRR